VGWKDTIAVIKLLKFLYDNSFPIGAKSLETMIQKYLLSEEHESRLFHSVK
jgi:hypothetical protein